MQHLNSDDFLHQQIAEKYLRGQLTAEEMTAFELYLMDHPQLIAQLQMDDLLLMTLPQVMIESPTQHHKPMDQAADQGEQTPLQVKPWLAKLSWLIGKGVKHQGQQQPWQRRPLTVSVATLVLCIIGYPLLNKVLRFNDVPDVLFNMQQVYLSPIRSGVTDHNTVDTIIQLDPQDVYFAVTLQTNDVNASVYQISITERNTSKVFMTAKNVTVNSRGEIQLTLSHQVYPVAEYQLEALPLSTHQVVSEHYYFSVRHNRN